MLQSRHNNEGDTPMTRAVGLWIDHRNAVVVAVTNQGETTSHVVSGVASHHSRAAGHPSHPDAADDRQLSRFTGHLATYYDEVIASIGLADAVLLFGPGEAKGELKDRLERDHHGTCPITIETADKMTDRQVAAKVTRHFSHAWPPVAQGN